jgi:hypothetical protein
MPPRFEFFSLTHIIDTGILYQGNELDMYLWIITQAELMFIKEL